MTNYFLIIASGSGILIYIIIRITEIYPPKSMNKMYGYRTPRSMKSQEHWDFAQDYSNVQMKKAALAMILLGLIGHFLNLGRDLELAVSCMIVGILTLAPVFITERALKDRFPEN